MARDYLQSFEITYNVSVDPCAMEVCEPVSSGYTRRSSSSDDHVHVQKPHCPPAAVQSATSYSKTCYHQTLMQKVLYFATKSSDGNPSGTQIGSPDRTRAAQPALPLVLWSVHRYHECTAWGMVYVRQAQSPSGGVGVFPGSSSARVIPWEDRRGESERSWE